MDKAVFDFGSSNFTVFANGRLLYTCKTAVVLTADMHPKALVFGDDAVAKASCLDTGTIFVRPVKDGQIDSPDGARALVRHCLSMAFGDNKNVEIAVLVACVVNGDMRLSIERLFVEAGFNAVFIMDAVVGLIPAAIKYGVNLAMIVGSDVTQLALIDDAKVVKVYAVNLGGNTVNGLIIDELRDNYSIIIGEAEAERVKNEICSLYEADFTRTDVCGTDKLTGGVKRISICGKDLYPQCKYVYSRVAKLIEGLLSSCGEDIVMRALEKGVVAAGRACRIQNFKGFTEGIIYAPVVLDTLPQTTHLQGADELINNNEWLMSFLAK